MTRLFDPSLQVRLPNLTANEAAALAMRFASAAKGKRVPASLAATLKKMVARAAALAAVRGKKQEGPPATPGTSPKQAREALGAAWRALFMLLAAYQALPKSQPEQGHAAAIAASLFSDGLRFTLLGNNEEWTESETRLDLITGQLVAAIEALGGEPFLRTLRAAHAAYGKALGITEATEAPAPDSPTVAAPLRALLTSMRQYVLRVHALVDEDQPDTAKLADELLLPLATWQVKERARAGGAAGAEAGDAAAGEGAGEAKSAPETTGGAGASPANGGGTATDALAEAPGAAKDGPAKHAAAEVEAPAAKPARSRAGEPRARKTTRKKVA